MTIGKDEVTQSTIVIMGINGFVGRHLARALKSRGCRVIGIGNNDGLADELKDVVEQYIQCDLSDEVAVQKIDFSSTTAIINLAGLANQGASFDNESEYLRINRVVHTNVCEAIKDLETKPRIIAVSTGAVYDSSSQMPLRETSPSITTGSPYALSKLGMETALADYLKQGMDIITVRPFNHTGPGQGPGFLVPDLLFQLKALKNTENPTLLVGNLKSKRDYTDVRDIAEAYCFLALAPVSSLSSRLYNICSGKSVSGEDILDMLLENLNLREKIIIEVDPKRIRPNDPADIYGDCSLLKKDTGWEPHIQLNQTLSDFIASA